MATASANGPTRRLPWRPSGPPPPAPPLPAPPPPPPRRADGNHASYVLRSHGRRGAERIGTGSPSLRMRSRAWRTTGAVSRSRGSSRSSPWMTWTSGPAFGGDGAGSSRMIRSVSSGEARLRCGGRPSTMANRTAPSAHRSDAAQAPVPRACSGEAYAGSVTCRDGSVPTWPKPDRTTSPSERIRTRAGLMSPWTMPARWAESRTARSWRPMRVARTGSSPPRQSSSTLNGRLSLMGRPIRSSAPRSCVPVTLSPLDERAPSTLFPWRYVEVAAGVQRL